jgi:uncharacterized cupredoxin-like copper-binding protein
MSGGGADGAAADPGSFATLDEETGSATREPSHGGDGSDAMTIARGLPAYASRAMARTLPLGRSPCQGGIHRLPDLDSRSMAAARRALLVTLVTAIVAGCRLVEGPVSPPPIGEPGTPERPREVNLIARDYSFDPPALELVAGETVLVHVVNAGLDVHEAVIGGPEVQAAWEAAQAGTGDGPPGPTPTVSVAPEMSGTRVVVGSGQRVDVTYTAPADSPGDLLVGCHIPGHFARGMSIPVRFVRPGV